MIDIAKIVLASEKLPVPQTYAQILELLPSVSGFESIPREITAIAATRAWLDRA